MFVLMFLVIMGRMLVFVITVLAVMLMVVDVGIVPVTVLVGMLMDKFVDMHVGMLMHVHIVTVPMLVIMLMGVLVRMQVLVLVSSLHALDSVSVQLCINIMEE